MILKLRCLLYCLKRCCRCRGSTTLRNLVFQIFDGIRWYFKKLSLSRVPTGKQNHPASEMEKTEDILKLLPTCL